MKQFGYGECDEEARLRLERWVATKESQYPILARNIWHNLSVTVDAEAGLITVDLDGVSSAQFEVPPEAKDDLSLRQKLTIFGGGSDAQARGGGLRMATLYSQPLAPELIASRVAEADTDLLVATGYMDRRMPCDVFVSCSGHGLDGRYTYEEDIQLYMNAATESTLAQLPFEEEDDAAWCLGTSDKTVYEAKSDAPRPPSQGWQLVGDTTSSAALRLVVKQAPDRIAKRMPSGPSDHTGPMYVSVARPGGGGSLKLSVSGSTAIQALKYIVQSELDYPVWQQILHPQDDLTTALGPLPTFFEQSEVEDLPQQLKDCQAYGNPESTLAELGVSPDSLLQLGLVVLRGTHQTPKSREAAPSGHSGAMSIKLAFSDPFNAAQLEGTVREVEVEGNATVLSIKELLRADPVQGSYTIPASTQHYIYDSMLLDDAATLQASGVHPGTTISVVLLPEEVISNDPAILLHIQLGEDPKENLGLFPAMVRRSETIQALKDKVDTFFNGSFSIVHNGEDVEDSTTLASLGLEEGTVLIGKGSTDDDKDELPSAVGPPCKGCGQNMVILQAPPSNPAYGGSWGSCDRCGTSCSPGCVHCSDCCSDLCEDCLDCSSDDY